MNWEEVDGLDDYWETSFRKDSIRLKRDSNGNFHASFKRSGEDTDVESGTLSGAVYNVASAMKWAESFYKGFNVDRPFLEWKSVESGSDSTISSTEFEEIGIVLVNFGLGYWKLSIFLSDVPLYLSCIDGSLKITQAQKEAETLLMQELKSQIQNLNSVLLEVKGARKEWCGK